MNIGMVKGGIAKLFNMMARANLTKGIKRFVSPMFVALFIASFVLWYVAKLSYTYTTELDVKVKIEDQKFETHCVVEGTGTNLLGYNISRGGALRIPIGELKYRSFKGEDDNDYLKLDKEALTNMIVVKYSDIKVISVDNPPVVKITEKIRRAIDRENLMKSK